MFTSCYSGPDFFVLTKFSMHYVGRMDVHRIYHLTVVHLFKCIFNIWHRAR